MLHAYRRPTSYVIENSKANLPQILNSRKVQGWLSSRAIEPSCLPGGSERFRLWRRDWDGGSLSNEGTRQTRARKCSYSKWVCTDHGELWNSSSHWRGRVRERLWSIWCWIDWHLESIGIRVIEGSRRKFIGTRFQIEKVWGEKEISQKPSLDQVRSSWW